MVYQVTWKESWGWEKGDGGNVESRQDFLLNAQSLMVVSKYIYIDRARLLLKKSGNRSAGLVVLALQEAVIRWGLVSMENNGLHLGLSTPS